MKNLIYLFSILTLVLTSCKEDIDPSLDGKTTVVVYGLLDQADTIHFFKINRAFTGIGDANENALIPDSSYFKTVTATIKEYQGGTLKRTWNLRDTMVQNKESGAFYGPDQKMYYFQTTKLNPLVADGTTEYRLEAILDKGYSTECTVSGKTKLITDFKITSPKSQQGSPAGSFSFALDEAQINGYKSASIKLATGTAKKIEVRIFIEFEEFINNNLAYTKKVDWYLGDADETKIINSTAELSASGMAFYQLIANNVTNDPAITKRILKSLTVTAYAADDNFQKYLLVNKPSSSLTQNKPTFTNLSINNDNRVIGIFAARNVIQNYYYKYVPVGSTGSLRCIDLNSLKELCLGQFTSGLLFCTDNPADISQTFYCN